MVGKSANPKGLTNDCQVKWKNWPDSSIRAFFLPLKWQSNKPQNWANVVETIMIVFTADKAMSIILFLFHPTHHTLVLYIFWQHAFLDSHILM